MRNDDVLSVMLFGRYFSLYPEFADIKENKLYSHHIFKHSLHEHFNPFISNLFVSVIFPPPFGHSIINRDKGAEQSAPESPNRKEENPIENGRITNTAKNK